MRTLLLSAAVTFSFIGPVLAAPVTATYDFTGFFSSGPNVVVSGSVSLTFDAATSAQATVNSFTSSVLGQYTPVNAYTNAGGYVFVGTNAYNSGYVVTSGTDSFGFYFEVDNVGLLSSGQAFDYTTSGSVSKYSATTFVVAREPLAVPEPATLALLALPMSLAGLVAARRKA